MFFVVSLKIGDCLKRENPKLPLITYMLGVHIRIFYYFIFYFKNFIIGA